MESRPVRGTDACWVAETEQAPLRLAQGFHANRGRNAATLSLKGAPMPAHVKRAGKTVAILASTAALSLAVAGCGGGTSSEPPVPGTAETPSTAETGTLPPSPMMRNEQVDPSVVDPAPAPAAGGLNRMEREWVVRIGEWATELSATLAELETSLAVYGDLAFDPEYEIRSEARNSIGTVASRLKACSASLTVGVSEPPSVKLLAVYRPFLDSCDHVEDAARNIDRYFADTVRRSDARLERVGSLFAAADEEIGKANRALQALNGG